MQSRMLQVTQLGNFHPVPWHISITTIAKAERPEVYFSVAANCRIRGPVDDNSVLVADGLGIHYPISRWRSCRQPPNVGK